MNDKMKAEFDAAFVKKFGFGRMMASANADAHQMLNAAEWAWEAAAAPTPPPAVQPVTMASVMRAYEYACDHPHKYLRGTSNWCAAVAWKLNQLESPAATPQQPIFDEANERQLFEDSMITDSEEAGFGEPDLYRDSGGCYRQPYHQAAWGGWIACAQSRAKAGEDES